MTTGAAALLLIAATIISIVFFLWILVCLHIFNRMMNFFNSFFGEEKEVKIKEKIH